MTEVDFMNRLWLCEDHCCDVLHALIAKLVFVQLHLRRRCPVSAADEGDRSNLLQRFTDNDDHQDDVDNCPTVDNQDQTNTDGLNDGGDACDQCVLVICILIG